MVHVLSSPLRWILRARTAYPMVLAEESPPHIDKKQGPHTAAPIDHKRQSKENRRVGSFRTQMGQFWAVLVRMEDRRTCSGKKSFRGVANGRDECMMVPFSRSKTKSRFRSRGRILFTGRPHDGGECILSRCDSDSPQSVRSNRLEPSDSSYALQRPRYQRLFDWFGGIRPTLLLASLVSILFLLRLPSALVSRELNVDESLFLSQAMKFTVDPRPWIGADVTTSGPLNSYFLSLFLLLGFKATFVLIHLLAAILVCLHVVISSIFDLKASRFQHQRSFRFILNDSILWSVYST